MLVTDDEEEANENTTMTQNQFLKLVTKDPPKTIYIRGSDDKLHSITLQTDETSLDLWTKAAEIVAISLDEICLALDETEEELDYDEYIPVDGDILVVMEPPSSITVTLPNGDKFELEVMPTATIAELKQVLEEETVTTQATQDQHRLFLLTARWS